MRTSPLKGVTRRASASRVGQQLFHQARLEAQPHLLGRAGDGLDQLHLGHGADQSLMVGQVDRQVGVGCCLAVKVGS